MKGKRKRLKTALTAAAVLALLVVTAVPLLRTKPLRVETAKASRGALTVTIDAEGKTRVRDRFTVAAPVAGRLRRVALRQGDAVRAGETVAHIEPPPLAPLDPRQRAEGQARVQAAEATRREADAAAEHARADLEQARRELRRATSLVEDGVISRQEYERARNAEQTAAKDSEAARHRAEAASREIEVARAALIALDRGQGDGAQPAVAVRAPSGGRVLRVLEESERVVAAGTPLVELSNTAKLEVVLEVLSSDAVKIRPGAEVLVEGWGGDAPLVARVRLVEPSAFTKVSALGVEEQRVSVVADFADTAGALGDAYRVEARVVTWEGGALKVPSSALFRRGARWCVFRVEGGRAREAEVEAGHRNQSEVEITTGLTEGDEVILHPPNEMADGAPVEAQGGGGR